MQLQETFVQPVDTPIALASNELQQLRSIADQLPADENKQAIIQELEVQIGEIPAQYNDVSAKLSGELLEEEQFRNVLNELKQQLEHPLEGLSPTDRQEFLITKLPLLLDEIEKLKSKFKIVLKVFFKCYNKLCVFSRKSKGHNIKTIC